MTGPRDWYIYLRVPLKEAKSTIHVGKLPRGRSPVEKKTSANKVADLSLYIFGNKATDGTKLDLKIGFQGLALIHGQIYNPG